MIAVDTNILVYAHRPDALMHIAAKESIRRLAEGRASWCIPWPCVHEFIGVVTKVYKPPSSIDVAVQQIDIWMESPSLRLIGEPVGYWEELRKTARTAKLAGPTIHDARVHTICRMNGVHTLWSLDRDFSWFRGLEIVNPCLS